MVSIQINQIYNRKLRKHTTGGSLASLTLSTNDLDIVRFPESLPEMLNSNTSFFSKLKWPDTTKDPEQKTTLDYARQKVMLERNNASSSCHLQVFITQKYIYVVHYMQNGLELTGKETQCMSSTVNISLASSDTFKSIVSLLSSSYTPIVPTTVPEF